MGRLDGDAACLGSWDVRQSPVSMCLSSSRKTFVLPVVDEMVVRGGLSVRRMGGVSGIDGLGVL